MPQPATTLPHTTNRLTMERKPSLASAGNQKSDYLGKLGVLYQL